jgi:hypothetical protein
MFIYDREHIVDKGGCGADAEVQRHIVGNIVLALRPWNTQMGNRMDSVREKSLVYGRGLQMAARFWVGYSVNNLKMEKSESEGVRGGVYDVSPKWSGVQTPPQPLAVRSPGRTWQQFFEDIRCCAACCCTRRAESSDERDYDRW